MLEKSLKRNPAVLNACVTFLMHKAEIMYDARIADTKALIGMVERLGYTAEPLPDSAATRITLSIAEQFDETLEIHLKALPGVTAVLVNSLEHTIAVDYDPNLTGVRTLIEYLGKLGYSATICNGKHYSTFSTFEQQSMWRNFWLSVCLSIPVLLLVFVFPQFERTSSVFQTPIVSGLSVQTFLEWIFTTPIQIWLGKPFYISAYKALRYGKQANVDVLIMLSTSTAYIYSIISTIISMSHVGYQGEH
jgi:Cu+-exporting ATPase